MPDGYSTFASIHGLPTPFRSRARRRRLKQRTLNYPINRLTRLFSNSCSFLIIPERVPAPLDLLFE